MPRDIPLPVGALYDDHAEEARRNFALRQATHNVRPPPSLSVVVDAAVGRVAVGLKLVGVVGVCLEFVGKVVLDGVHGVPVANVRQAEAEAPCPRPICRR